MQKNLFKFIALFLALICVFYFYKKLDSSTENISEVVESEVLQTEDVYENALPDDFHIFYDRFHTDSLFQLERILFPLKGLAKSTDTTKIAAEVLWQKADWKQHKPFNDFNGTFERTFTNISGIISELISANNGLFTLEKRYSKLAGQWYLIYYQELIMAG